jgi:hypothetical protein
MNMAEAIPADTSEELTYSSICSAVTVASMPWAFTQHQPLDTSKFISEAKRRDFDLDLSTLRELYHHKLIVPFVYVRNR